MTELQKINACAKRPIDIWTNFLYYPLSIRLVYLIRQTRISPNALTISSLIIALCGCIGFATGGRAWELWGLLAVQISYVVDCADGQLARYKKQFSPVGGWIDQVADRIKEFSIYLSLVVGYTTDHGSHESVWVYAMTAIFALYLLEYYGQIKMGKMIEASAPTATATTQPRADQFARAQRFRAFVPFRGFLIGEQYFALLVFLVFDAIKPLFIFVTILGLCMCIYRPVVQYIKLNRNLA